MRCSTFLLALFVASSAFGALPALTVESDDGNVALELSALSIRTTIRGHLARTEFELTYRNSLDRIVGGDFTFPLPPDAEVSDLGLWFGNTLRQGVAVERVLARAAYEEVVHRNVDPALAEWSSGRAFRLRVFPIPPKGEKKVFIAYDEELTTGDYTLDLRFGKVVETFELVIDAEGAAVRTEGNVRMQSRGAVVDGVVSVVRDATPAALAAQTDDGWYATMVVDLDASSRNTPPTPHVTILYDVSASMVQQDAVLLRRFLAGFLAKQQAWATADVIPFHAVVEAPRRINNIGSPGGIRELERTLDNLQPLGATNLLAVAAQLPKLAAAIPSTSRIVLVTDGIASLGNTREIADAFSKLAGIQRPLLIVHAGISADDALLANLAKTTGGWAIDLKRIAPEAAVDASLRLPSVVQTGATPERILVTSATRASIAMRAKDPIAQIGNGDAPVRVLYNAREASMVRRAYARAKLREMLAGGATDDEILAHGRAYTQLTPRTSLLVLETWRDYEEYSIPMPPDVIAEKGRDEAERNRVLATGPVVPKPISPPTVVHGGWSLHGRILESSGVPLPGVVVQLKDGPTLLSIDVTNADGRYLVTAPAAPADPVIEADLEGFNRTTRKLPDGTPGGGMLDITIQLASVSESITVTAEAPVMQMTTQSFAATVTSLRVPSAATERLLSLIDADEVGEDADDPEVQEAVAKQRRELTESVIAKLRATSSASARVRYYISARGLLGGDKSFHVFAAEALRERSPDLAVRVLLDLAETRPDDAPMLRILARVLDGWDEPELARLLLQRALEVSPREPQTWRELILLDARHGRAERVESWSKRLQATRRKEFDVDEVYEQTDEALARWKNASPGERQRGVDLRADENDELTIELMFDVGWSWVDLHVIEPSGERVSWDAMTSEAGATFTGGGTFGYGPEIYRIRDAPPGTYRLEIDYFQEDISNLSTETLVHVVIHQRRRGQMERRDLFIAMANEEERKVLATINVD